MPDITAPSTPLSNVEWHVYDYADKAKTAPPRELTEELVWIVEKHYTEGVDLGYFDGFTFRTWNGSDDCSVAYWAEIDYPDPPEGRNDGGDDD